MTLAQIVGSQSNDRLVSPAREEDACVSGFFGFLFVLVLVFFFFRAAPAAYGGSQARGSVGGSCSHWPVTQPQQHQI